MNVMMSNSHCTFGHKLRIAWLFQVSKRFRRQPEARRLVMSSLRCAVAHGLSTLPSPSIQLLLCRRNALAAMHTRKSRRRRRLSRLAFSSASEWSNTVSHVTVTRAERNNEVILQNGLVVLGPRDTRTAHACQATGTVLLLYVRRGDWRNSHWPCRTVECCRDSPAVPSSRTA
jgi:hypothetical protein